MEDPDEFETLLKLFNQYPLEELIIHPRVREDFYSNLPDEAVFAEALQNSVNPVCYNGNIFSAQDFRKLRGKFPRLSSVMIGRGVIANPDLCRECMADAASSETSGFTAGKPESREAEKKELYRRFHDRIYREYQELLSGERNVLFKMKEIWSYMIQSFSDYEAYAKNIRKSETLREYEAAVHALFREQGVISNGRLSF